MFVVTHSDSALQALAQYRLRATGVAWFDPLDFGRVPAMADAQEFCGKRARALQAYKWHGEASLEEKLRERNQALSHSLEREEETVLLFGPSLRDCLQIAQIISMISLDHPASLERLSLGIAAQSSDLLEPEQMQTCLEKAELISMGQVTKYRSFWQAFLSPDPRFLAEALNALGSEGFLPEAAFRLLREYPSADNGLSLAEAQALDAIKLGVEAVGELYEACQETEAKPYLREREFASILHRLASGLDPLIETLNGSPFQLSLFPGEDEAYRSQAVHLTQRGQTIVACDTHYCDGYFPSRWIGGTHLNQANIWVWDYALSKLVRREKSAAALVT